MMCNAKGGSQIGRQNILQGVWRYVWRYVWKGISRRKSQSWSRLLANAPVLGMVVMLASCSALRPSGTRHNVLQAPVGNQALQHIAENFVSAISQVNGLQPGTTTLRFYKATTVSALQHSLNQSMQEYGYTVETVSDPLAANLVSHKVSQNVTAESGEKYVYEVSVGDVHLRRGYIVAAHGSIEPVTSMFMKGADPVRIKLDDSIFKTY